MRCKQFIIVSLAGVVLAASLAGCGGAAPASSAAASSEAASSVVVSSAAAETALPDGVYTADFETDSSMFHPNEACNGKGTLTVENGVMTFHVSLASKKIVNLYPGLAADAEANKTAWLIPTVDTVTYADGTTEEVYGYDIPVEALDTDFQLALLGTKGKWYDHIVSVRNAEPKTEQAAEIPADGTYTAAVVLEGGSGRATAPADTDELVFDHTYPLDYATQFTADCYADGSTLLTIPDAQAKFLVRPEGAATLRTVPAGVTVLQQPVQNIYLVSTSAMDLFLHLDALDSIALSGTRAEGWYLDEAKQAMQAGRIAYAGKYSAPDYERILTAECGLAVENTMIYHTPEVKEQLERFGIPVLVERSSYESSPLARMEWIKLYGILLGKEALAEEVFAQQAQRIAPLLEQPSTGKRCAFFSITSSGLATVRKSGDYVAQMIGMAGGEYVFADLADSGNSLSTMNIPLEDLYAGVKDADVLIYNGTIEGSISTKEELLARCALLAECKAVQSGNIWCTTPSFFQQSMALADFMLDLHAVFTGETADPDTLHFLTKIT